MGRTKKRRGRCFKLIVVCCFCLDDRHCQSYCHCFGHGHCQRNCNCHLLSVTVSLIHRNEHFVVLRVKVLRDGRSVDFFFLGTKSFSNFVVQNFTL